MVPCSSCLTNGLFTGGFFLDECHLLWGDVCGYVWAAAFGGKLPPETCLGQTNIRIEVPIQNERERQTYFGALNYQPKEFIIREYSAGNSENTICFIKDLQLQCPGQRIAVIWDGASSHKSESMKTFLASVNDGYESTRRQVTCILLAPNAPQQNPRLRCLVTGKELFEKILAV